jgi:PII-like signaling protein/nucleotide-binding universal stress UspA family protein
MFQRILIALDDTPAAKSAFAFGVDLARAERAELYVLAVGEIPEATAGTVDEVRDAQRHAREKLVPLLRAARAKAEAMGKPVVTELRFGHAADVIVSYAAEHEVDLVVLGKQHRHLGATGARVIRRAPCPVFVASETDIVKFTGPADRRAEGWEVRKDTREKLEGRAKMLRVYMDERDSWEGAPLYEAIVRRLRESDIAGASVFRAIMGYGATHRVHKSAFLGLSHDLPVLVVAVDTEEKIRGVLPALDEMVQQGLIALSTVEVIKYTHTHRDLDAGETPRRRSADW